MKPNKLTTEDALRSSTYWEAPYLYGINDSMELDSDGKEIAWFKTIVRTPDDRKFLVDVSLRVVGDVKVLFKGEWYRNASSMPNELIKCYHDGTNPSDIDSDYDVVNNNWFEEFIKITENDKVIYNDSLVIDSIDGADSIADEVIGIINELINSL